MKQSIVKDLTTDEVREKLKEERVGYIKLKMAHAVSPLDNALKIKTSRRAIARMETELKKRSMQQEATK